MKLIVSRHGCVPQEQENIQQVVAEVSSAIPIMQQMSTDTIIDILDSYGKALLSTQSLRDVEGVAFLSFWLRRHNLESMLSTGLNGYAVGEPKGEGKKLMIVQPRGLVCHWIAGNVPTLALFSLFQSMLVKNANIVRAPQVSADTICRLMDLLSKTKTASAASGKSLLEGLAIVIIPKEERQAQEALSLAADCRVIWGGTEAVQAIRSLPRFAHCEDIVFGPKYSFAVVDNLAANSEKLQQYMAGFGQDVVFVEQSGCSSPHIVFVEGTLETAQHVARALAEELEKLSKRQPKKGIDTSRAAQIIDIRARYALGDNTSVICSEGLEWTVLVDNELRLEEPIQSRTIFVKPVSSLRDVLPLITRSVQTIGHAIEDPDKLISFSKEATRLGVSRIIPGGQMNFYDTPWDGMLVISRLVMWNSVVLRG